MADDIVKTKEERRPSSVTEQGTGGGRGEGGRTKRILLFDQASNVKQKMNTQKFK